MAETIRILLTGASGFLGRQVSEHLASQGHHVMGVGRDRKQEISCDEWIGMDLLECDMDRLVEQAKPDVLIHLAWVTRHGQFWTAAENLTWVGASLRLLLAFAAGGGKRAIFAGTCAEYDLAAEPEKFKESMTAAAPSMLYGVAKDATRRVCESYCSQTGVSFAWARLFFLFGPFEDPGRLGGSICRALTSGQEARCSSGRQVRDFLSTVDAGTAIAELALSKAEGPVNIGSGQAMTIAQFAEAFGRASGNPDLIRLGALPDRPGEPRRIVADITRLEQEVGFCPAATFEQRVQETLDWWRASL